MVPLGTAAKPSWCPAISLVGAAAEQPRTQSGGADLALSAQPLARQLGVSQPRPHHRCLRDSLEPVCQQPRPSPLALRGRLGSGFARSVGVPAIEPRTKIEGHSCPEIFGDRYYAPNPKGPKYLRKENRNCP